MPDAYDDRPHSNSWIVIVLIGMVLLAGIIGAMVLMHGGSSTPPVAGGATPGTAQPATPGTPATPTNPVQATTPTPRPTTPAVPVVPLLPAPGPTPVYVPPTGGPVRIGIAYGTEKRNWLTWALGEFQKTENGRHIQVDLIPMGSLEGAQALLAGDKRVNVWSPASAIYKDVLVSDWTVKYGNNPILKEDHLAYTPMVFVMWEERYDAFIAKYKEVSFDTLSQALAEKGGWDAIAGKPEWGLFKFGHTHPNKSNSGLVTLILMAYDYHHKTKGLMLKDLLDTKFQTWMNDFERAISGMVESTGDMMKEMVLKGPSSYDGLIVYESVVIDYLKGAQGRWGNLRVVYPKLNIWNDNPYYIIDAPWSSPEQRKACEVFLAFLMSDPIQKPALTHGFRPGNPNVPINEADSPFTLDKKFGLQIDLNTVCDPPSAEVLNNLLAIWQRNQGNR